ncbi:MAG TPA: SAF domain-containing protein [Gemmataceae bacterium]|nr:SAF domain-containing protein [Gemmataceae bacterium]
MSALRIIVPVVLGVIAAILNFMVLRGSTAPLELTALRTDIKADTEITEDMLDRLQVRADKEIFKSAIPYSERGLLLGRRVTRPVSAGEVLLYADVHNLDEENIRLYLKPGETTLTIPVKSSRVAPSLRRGDSVGVLVSVRPMPEPTKTVTRPPAPITRMLGPFRLLSVGAPVDPYRGAGLGDTRLLLVAIKPGPGGQIDPGVATLQEAIAAGASGGNSGDGGVLAVEYYQQRP